VLTTRDVDFLKDTCKGEKDESDFFNENETNVIFRFTLPMGFMTACQIKGLKNYEE
jgi:hydroxymethylglutaryl-CoA reductase